MVSGRFKSRTFARKQVRMPGGKTVLKHVLRKPKKAHCAETGEPLHGVARERPMKLKKLSKSQKVPSRPFAGTLGSKAMRRTLIRRARTKE